MEGRVLLTPGPQPRDTPYARLQGVPARISRPQGLTQGKASELPPSAPPHPGFPAGRPSSQDPLRVTSEVVSGRGRSLPSAAWWTLALGTSGPWSPERGHSGLVLGLRGVQEQLWRDGAVI